MALTDEQILDAIRETIREELGAVILQTIRETIREELGNDRVVGLKAIAEYLMTSELQLRRIRKRYQKTNPCPIMHQKAWKRHKKGRFVWAFKWSLQLWWFQIRQAEEERRLSYLRSKGRAA